MKKTVAEYIKITYWATIIFSILTIFVPTFIIVSLCLVDLDTTLIRTLAPVAVISVFVISYFCGCSVAMWSALKNAVKYKIITMEQRLP